jgi:hypothetical protein
MDIEHAVQAACNQDYQNNHLTSIRDNFLYAVSLECTPMEEKQVEPM